MGSNPDELKWSERMRHNFKMVYLIRYAGKHYHAHDVDELLKELISDIKSHIYNETSMSEDECEEACQWAIDQAMGEFSVLCWCGTHNTEPCPEQECTNPKCDLIPLHDMSEEAYIKTIWWDNRPNPPMDLPYPEELKDSDKDTW